MKTKNQSRISLLAATACVLALGVFNPNARAANIWDGGGGNGSWNTGDNWDDGNIPTTGNFTLTFAGDTQTSTTNDLLAVNPSFAGIFFTNNGTVGTSAFTLAGSNITLGSGGDIITTAVTGTAITDTISLNLIMSANRVFNTGSLHNLIISGVISQTNASKQFTKTGLGTATLTNAGNSWLGSTIFNNGLLIVDSGAGTAGIANVGVTSALGAASNATNAQLRFSSGALSFASGAASTNRQVVIGSSTVTSPAGGTITNNSANGSTPLVFSNATFNVSPGAGITANRTLTLGGTNTDANAINGIIADNNTGGNGTVALVKDGPGIWTLGGNNTYTGATAINGGRLNLGHNNALGLGNATSTWGNGTTLDNTSGSAIVLPNNAAWNLGSANGDIITFGGSNHLDLGTGRVSLSNDIDKTLVLNGNSTLTLGTVFSQRNGNNNLTVSQGAGSGAQLVLRGLELNSHANQTTAKTLTINTNVTVTITGAVTDGGNGTVTLTNSLAKRGTGTLVLSGNSTYTGNTTVSAGTMVVNGYCPAVNGTVTVAAAGTLGGTGTLGGGTTLNGTLACNLSTVPGSHDKLDIAGSLNLGSPSTLNITTTGNAATTGNYTLVAAAGGINGSITTLNLPSGWSGNAIVSGNDLVLNVTSLSGSPSANVTFTSAGQSVAETAGTAILTVTATGATGTITANVTFDSGNSTATTVDIGGYATQTVTLNASNSYTANVTVTITDDAIPEPNETAAFQLTDLTGSAVLASPSAHTLTILANDSFAAWAASYNVTNSTTANDDTDKFLNGEEYAFDLNPTVAEYGNVLASSTGISSGNVTMTLAFNGNSSKQDINYVVRRSALPAFTTNTVVGFWNGTNNWTTSNGTYFGNETQSGAGDVKAINVNMSIPAATEPRQFLKVNIE